MGLTIPTEQTRDLENSLPGGVYNSTPPTVPDGGYVPDQVDVNGNKKVTLAGAATGNTTVGGTFTGFQNTLPWAVFNTTPTVRTSGQGGPLQADENGSLKNRETHASTAEDNPNQVIASAIRPLAVSTYSWTRFQNLGANATLNVKATPGNVKAVHCRNINAAAHYVQLHNTATVPAGGAVPLYTFLVPATSAITIGDTFFGEHGAHFTTGIAFAFSTTEATYTAATATDQMTHIMFK